MPHGPDSLEPKLDVLLHDLCEGRITPEAHEELRQLLANSDECRRRYVEVVYLSMAVTDWAQRELNAEALEQSVSALVAHASDTCIERPSDRVADVRQHKARWAKRNPVRLGKPGWAGLSAACLAGISLVALLTYGGPGNKGATATKEPNAVVAEIDEGPAPAGTHTQFVAHVLDATPDVTWSANSAPFDLMLRISPGERLAVETGVLRLKYFSGAEIILHGPAVFLPTGPASGHLVAGRITGSVSAVGTAGFRLSTPNAEVIDLGTEFGVSVGDSAEMDVFVFDGEVEVSSAIGLSADSGPIRLKEGMGVRLDANGLVDATVEIDHGQFLRQLPDDTDSPLVDGEVSLVDAFISGPGMSHRLVATLDPVTGKPDEQPTRCYRDGNGVGYRRAVYNEFVDGVFIPPRGGRTTQLDSLGNEADLPWNLGRTDGAVWARRPLSNWLPGEFVSTAVGSESWGVGATKNVLERLVTSRLGVIGVHANVGLTFDLHRIQSVEARSVERFRCTLANLGDSLPSSPPGGGETPRTDVRVYVDGEERFVYCGLTRADGDQLVDIKMGARDRTLTIVTTNSGSDYSPYGKVVLIDPILELAD